MGIYQKVSDQEKIKRLLSMWSDVVANIEAGEAVSFSKLIKSHNIQWCKGAKSVLYILRNKMKVISGKRGKIMQLTERFKDHFATRDIDYFARKLLIQIEKWTGRKPIAKKKKTIIKDKTIPHKKQLQNQIEIAFGDSIISPKTSPSKEVKKDLVKLDSTLYRSLTLDAMEVLGLKQILSRLGNSFTPSEAEVLIARQVLEKL